MHKTSAEKRKHPRYTLSLRVDYSDTEDFYSEWTENLSAGGFFVRTDRDLEVGARLTVHLSFPALLEPLAIEGCVAWIRSPTPMQPGGVGIDVTDETSRRRLAELTQRAREQSIAATVDPFRVVVVEDNPRVTRSYERVLKRLGALSGDAIQVSFAPNGHAALALIEQQGADLVVTDVYMPVMDGFGLIERLRESPRTVDLPVIVITGGRAGERARARELGVTAFLYKPVHFGQLLETIICLLNVIEAKREGSTVH